MKTRVEEDGRSGVGSARAQGGAEEGEGTHDGLDEDALAHRGGCCWLAAEVERERDEEEEGAGDGAAGTTGRGRLA